MPNNKKTFIYYKYLDRLLSDRHHYYDNNDQTDKVNDLMERDALHGGIVFDKYGIIKGDELSITLENEDTNIKPIPVGAGGGKPQPEMYTLSNIVEDSNYTYGNIEWKNRDEVQLQKEDLLVRIATSVDFVNAVRNGDRQITQITFDDDIINIVAGMLEEKMEFVQTYFANPDFQNFVNARVFQATVSQLSSRRI